MELLILFSALTLTFAAPYYSQPGSANMDSNSWSNYNSGSYQYPQNQLGNQNQGYNAMPYNDRSYYGGTSTNNYYSDPNHDPNEGMSSDYEQRQYFQQEQRNQGQQYNQQSDNGRITSLSQLYNRLVNGGNNSLFGNLSFDEISSNILDAISSRISNNNK